MKPFTVAAALEAGVVGPDTIVDTSPGMFRVGSQLVRDHHNLGPIDIATLLRKSSNVGASKIALSLSAEQLWALYSRLGFGTTTGSTYPGEVAGQLPDFRGWSRFERCTLSFGYGLSVTSLQLAQAYGVLAADGIKRPLSLLVRDEVPAGERVLSVETARRLRSMLETVVSAEGTAPRAAVPGYRVAGKTGTAKKSIAGGYAKDRYQAVFAGMAPASDPRLVMVVMIDEPGAGEFYGGTVAAPVFAEVMAGALRLLNVAPDNLEQDQPRLAGVEVQQ
jgi:cell division protein FtsI (penicillin-binding protein 3)